jgi:hypothetical protein
MENVMKAFLYQTRRYIFMYCWSGCTVILSEKYNLPGVGSWQVMFLILYRKYDNVAVKVSIC